MFFEAFEIEFSVIGQQVKFPQLTAIIVTHRTVSTPVPITGQDVVTPFRIVVNDVMENAGAARGGAGTDITVRAGFAKTLINGSFQIIRIALNRCISNDFFRRQCLLSLLYDIKHDQIAVFIE